MELLVVLAIISVLVGVSIGALQRGVPRRELARNEIVSKLRRARVFSVAEQAPAAVVLQPGNDVEWPTVRALGRKSVGVWHLEGTDLTGFPRDGTGVAIDDDPSGVLGRAVRLSGVEVSYLDFGRAPSFDSERGMACELFVKPAGPGDRTLVQKGDVFRLTADQAGYLSVSVRIQVRTAEGELEATHENVVSDRPALVDGRWTKVASSYDGMALRLYANDALVGESVRVDWAPVVPDPQEPVVVGNFDRPFDGSVDELRWGVYVAEVSEPLMDTEVISQETLVRFAPGGELDPRFHTGAVDLGVRTAGGAEAWVTVGILGGVN